MNPLLSTETRKPIFSRRWALLALTGGLVVAAGALLGLTRQAPAAPAVTPSPAPTAKVVPAAGTGRAPEAAGGPTLAAPANTPELLPSPAAPPTAGRAPLARPIRYAAIGASDTVGVGTRDPDRLNWTARVAAQLPPDTVYQRFARSGITLGEALDREVPDAIRFRPTLVTVWLAVNDSLRGVPLSVYQHELRILLDQLTGQTEASVVVLDVPDLANALQPAAPTATRQQVRAVAEQWNRTIAAATAPYGPRVLVVDLFTPSEQAAVHADWISPDGFHPSAAGYQQIADITGDALRKAGLLP